MVDNRLRIPNLCWQSTATAKGSRIHAHHLIGRYATAEQVMDTAVLTRDPLGLNKLFVGYRPNRGLIAANYLTDLVDADVPFSRIYAVPAGTSVTFSHDGRVSVTRDRPRPSAYPTRHPATLIPAIAAGLRDGMHHLAACHPGVPVVMCLSGGADSSLIALYAKERFPQMVAYTYTYSGEGADLSQDAEAAVAVAQHLEIPVRIVPADADAVLCSLPRALVHGQDWRDFNVHAAIVNELLAAAIAADHKTGPMPVVLTGDLMNELLGDYMPVTYGDIAYYQLPALTPHQLRTMLTRTVQSTDREVGVFAARNLTVAQPYGWVYEHILALPDTPKHEVITALANAALPPEILRRPKVRAQIGDADAHRGILPLLLRTGYDARQLEVMFCELFNIDDPAQLRHFLRAGLHRPPPPSLL